MEIPGGVPSRAQVAVEPEVIDESPSMEAFVEGEIPFEIVDGVPVELPPIAFHSATLASRLTIEFGSAACPSGA